MGNSQNKKLKRNNSNQSNKYVSTIKPPSQFMTEEEFFKTWNIWKDNFLLYKTTLNEDNSNKQYWGNMLLNLMGPIGQNIYSTFTFNSQNDKEDINVLLKKFDQYSIFSGKKKLPLECVYEYINDLQFIMREKDIKNGEELIREKILTEIDEHRFTKAAKSIIPTFIFSSNFNKLTLKEIAFIWELFVKSDSAVMACVRCGRNHNPDKCPALGKQCSKCNDLNHFPKRCPINFIFSCHYCGGAHARRKCAAFNEICTKCKKSNHFSWKCQASQILQCYNCGLSHVANRSHCPAKNTTCTNCKIVGHLASKCNKKSHTRRY